MMNNNYPPGVFNLPDDKTEFIEHNYEVSGIISVGIYENENKKDYLEENIRSILYNAYKNGDIELTEY